MANCDICGEKLSFFTTDLVTLSGNEQVTVCGACKEKIQSIQGKYVHSDAVAILESAKQNAAAKTYSSLVNEFNYLREHFDAEYSAQVKETKARTEAQLKGHAGRIIVTTGDLKQDYDVIGPVYFQVSNKGLFSSALTDLIYEYSEEIAQMRSSGTMSRERADWGFLYGEWSVGQNDFEKAFYVATQELKKRAALLGADAIICMRQDIDLDTNAFAYFYLQMYGTAVKFK